MARVGALWLVVAAIAAAATAAATTPADSFSATPTVLSTSGDTVTLTWVVAQPTFNDTIVVRAGMDTSDQGGLNIGYFNVNQVPGWATGSASLAVPVINMRSAVTFQYLKGGLTGTPAAPAVTVTFQYPNEPQFVRLAYTSDTSSLSVMWTSGALTRQYVKWGTDPANVYSNMSAAEANATYSRKDLCGGAANTTGFSNPGYFYNAVMTGLSPNTPYFYIVGSDETGWSTQHWTAGPNPVGPDTDTYIEAFGDLGVMMPQTDSAMWVTLQEQMPPAFDTLSWVMQDLGNIPTQSMGSRFVLHIGDISYARGYEYLWDAFLHQIEVASSIVPYMVGVGNHEFDWPTQSFKPKWSNYGTDSGGECGVPYSRLFHMPGDESHGNGNFWYSFDAGNVHLVIFSTEHDFTAGSEQWKWIEADLAAVNRTRTPWLIAAGHRPIYSSSEAHDIGTGVDTDKPNEHLREAIEPLFAKYEVDLYICGHVHKYERTCGVRNYTCQPEDEQGTVHLVVGSAGNTYQVEWADNLPQSPSVTKGHHVQPKWSIFRSEEFGYARIHTNATSLHMQFIGDQRGQVHDELWLSKQYN